MLRRLTTMLTLVTVLVALPPATSMAQIIPNPIGTPSTGAPSEAPVRVPFPPAASPEYGIGAYLMGYPETTARDVALIKGAKFQWIKLTVPWRSVEPSCKGCIDWDDLDRVVLAASQAGLKILARVDHPPGLGPRRPGRERPARRSCSTTPTSWPRWPGGTPTAPPRAPSTRSRSGTSPT